MTELDAPPGRARTPIARRAALAVTAAAAVAGLLTGCSDSTAETPEAVASVVSPPASAGVDAGAFTKDAEGNVTGLSYPGEDGETALALLLRADPDATVTGSGKNAFVVGIGGRVADDSKHEFWSLSVDGKQAQVGAGSLTTKDGETISWQIATY